MSVKAKEKNLILEFVIDPNCDDELVTDSLRVRQVILNLIGNAIKFTSEGFVKILISSEMKDSVRYVILDVADSGIGVGDSDRETIFEAYAQAEDSTTRRFGGTGLGLALSRKLAVSLGGNLILLKSLEGRGSTFRLKIQDQKGLLKVRPFKSNNPRVLDHPSGGLDGMQILVVDDSTDNLLLICHYLKNLGAVVATAPDGEVGLRMALEGQFDVILMDIQMPIMDGYTATRELRKRGYNKPIVALTAHVMNDVIGRCLEAGCSTYLAKPVDLKDLVNLLQPLKPVSNS